MSLWKHFLCQLLGHRMVFTEENACAGLSCDRCGKYELLVDFVREGLVTVESIDPPKWEAVAALDGDEPIGWRVRWSEADEQGRYLWVRHYLTGQTDGEPRLSWCQHAAERDAQKMNDDGRRPEEWEEFRRCRNTEQLS